MNFCACAIPASVEPNVPLFAAGVCLTCGLLHERAALTFLTADGGANFSLHSNSPAASADVDEWLRIAKARTLDAMCERLAELRGQDLTSMLRQVKP